MADISDLETDTCTDKLGETKISDLCARRNNVMTLMEPDIGNIIPEIFCSGDEIEVLHCFRNEAQPEMERLLIQKPAEDVIILNILKPSE